MPPKKAGSPAARKTRTAKPGEAGAASAARRKPSRAGDAARRFAVDSARLMEAEHCEDTLVFDLRGISPVCDYFVIGTGTSDRQMRAVADHLEQLAAERGDRPYGVAGYEEGHWIVLDYVDVMIHLFEGDYRAYYDLESLWGDSPRVKWQR